MRKSPKMSKPDVSQLNLYSYDPRALRYKNLKNGRFVSAKEVRDAVDTVIDKEALRLQSIAQQLVDGKINLPEWQIQTSAALKNLHVAMGLAAGGGLNNISSSDLGYIASQVKEQYKYLRGFALQIKRGEQKLDASLVARSGSYAQSARGTYESVLQRRAKGAGLKQERSMLDSSALHCSPCVNEAGKGWVSVGSLIPIGQRSCLWNCRCYMLYRAGEAA
jgi:hypothetical protein